MTLMCQSSSSWEFCIWKQKNAGVDQKECLLEWKRAKGGVAVQECDDSLNHRVTISGNYDRHECGLTISAVTTKDAGTWECEVGIKDNASLNNV